MNFGGSLFFTGKVSDLCCDLKTTPDLNDILFLMKKVQHTFEGQISQGYKISWIPSNKKERKKERKVLKLVQPGNQ